MLLPPLFSFLFLLSAFWPSTLAGREKIREPYCSGRVPRTSWPKSAGSFPWTRYASMSALCIGGDYGLSGVLAAYNMGCQCRTSRKGQERLICTAPLHWEYSESQELVKACVSKCRCPSDGTPIEPDTPDSILRPSSDSEPNTPDLSSDEWRSSLRCSFDQERCTLQDYLETLSSKEAGDEDECRASPCSSFSECTDSRREGGCAGQMCVLSSVWSRSPPYKGTCLTRQEMKKFFSWTKPLGQLGLAQSIGGRKRTRRSEDPESIPTKCLCNVTYVSDSCCGTVDGIVQQ